MRAQARSRRHSAGTQKSTHHYVLHPQVLLNANKSSLSTLRYGDAKLIPADDVLVSYDTRA